MYTADDIRNVLFTKTFGGYKIDEVDDFIDECADTVEELTKANEELKKKMEVLANKVMEYRQDEDSIRTALLSAQRMGDTVLREANHKATLILDDANAKAEKIEETAMAQIKDQLAELEHTKKLVSDFKTQILSVYRDHLTLINALPDHKAEEPAEQAETIEEPEQTTIEQSDETEETPVTEAVETETLQEVNSTDINDAEDEEKPVDRFANLKFGTDYNIADDLDEDDDTQLSFGRKQKR